MAYQIKILDLPDQPVLSRRKTLAVDQLPEFFSQAYGSIMAYLEELGESVSGMPYAAYYNLDMQALDVEAGFPTSKNLPGRGEIMSSSIKGGKFLSTIHKGSYDTMAPAYDALKEFAYHKEYSLSGLAYEYYLNDPSEDPSGIPLTEIRVPLE